MSRRGSEDRQAAGGGERGTRRAGSQGATGTRARGTRREGCSGGNLRHGRATRETRPRDPTATDTRAVPRRPAWDAERPFSKPPSNPSRAPRAPPPGAPKQPQPQAQHQGPHIARFSSVPDALPLRETGAHPAGTLTSPKGPGGPTPAPRTRGHRHRPRLGTGAGGEPARSGTLRAPTARGSLPAARTSGPARRDPPPTRKGGGAGHSRRRATRSAPTAGAGGTLALPTSTPSRGEAEEEGSPQASRYGSATTNTQRERGGRPGDPVPQGTPLRSLEKTFSPRVGHTPRPASRPSSGPQGRSGTPGEGEGARGVRRNLRQP